MRPTGTATFSDKHVGTSKPATVNVSLTGSLAGNYTLSTTVVSTSAAITAKPITVTAATDTKPYDGNTSFTGVPTITAGTFTTRVDATGVNLVFTTSYIAPAPVANMTIGPVSVGNSSISYSGAIGNRFVLVRSPDVEALLSTWEPVTTNTATSGSFTIADTPLTPPQRFYRVRVQ